MLTRPRQLKRMRDASKAIDRLELQLGKVSQQREQALGRLDATEYGSYEHMVAQTEYRRLCAKERDLEEKLSGLENY